MLMQQPTLNNTGVCIMVHGQFCIDARLGFTGAGMTKILRARSLSRVSLQYQLPSRSFERKSGLQAMNCAKV